MASFATLGEIVFEAITGFQEFTHKTETSIAELSRISGKPRLQNTGDKLDAVTLKVRFHVQYCDPEEKISELEDLRLSREAKPLVFGNGFYVGDFVISSLSRSYVQTDGEGNIIDVNVDIGLMEYFIDDPEGEKNILARKKGFANSDNNPQNVRSNYSSSQAKLAALQMSASKSQSEKINKDLVEAEKNPSTRARRFNQAVKNLDSMANSLSKLQNIVFGNAGLLTTNQILLDNIRGTLRAIANLKTICEAEDVGSVNKANQDLQTAMRRTSSSSTSLVAIQATRKPF